MPNRNYGAADALRHIWAHAFVAWGKGYELTEAGAPPAELLDLLDTLKEVAREHITKFTDDFDHYSDGRPTFGVTPLIGEADYVTIRHPDPTVPEGPQG